MAPQMHPLFNPAASPTYHAFTSASPRCPQPPYQHEPGTGLCVFRLAGEVSASGYLSNDHFRINYGGVDPFYTFGCAHFTWRFSSEGRAAGVLAMGRAPTSFATQAAERGLTSFSYCLSGDTKTRGQGFLRFGADVPRGPRYRTTRILPAQGLHDSAQALRGSTGDVRARQRRGGCIVDIGEPVMVLVEDAYCVVEEAVWSDLERHGAEPVHQAGYGFCVRATAAVKGSLPSLSLHFDGEDATLLVSPKQLFLIVNDERAGQVACLAVVPGRRTVIGALHQVDMRFVFDLKDNKLSFAPESCIQDTLPLA
ncbi:unnamed protein product [Urochloa humidicola]